MHSHDFRDAEEFRNKNVIVLGSSYSAEDIALQCNKYGAKSVTIGYRHNPMGFKWPDGMKEVHYLDRLEGKKAIFKDCLLYTSPSPRDRFLSRMPSSA